MRTSESSLNDKSSSGTDSNQVLVIDVVRYISGLAKLHEAEKIGNKGLSVGLRHLANALRPYADSSISELPSTLRQSALQSNIKRSSKRPKVELPSSLESLGQGEVEKILENNAYTKEQIAELGAQRFGISRSKLARLRKSAAQESIRAALANEKSLDVIANEARVSGAARSS